MRIQLRSWGSLPSFLRALLLWGIIGIIVIIGILLGVDRVLIGLVVFIFGIATQAFAGLLAFIALIPFVGPLFVKVLTLPFFWILNGVGYYLAIFAIRRGYTREVLNYRVLTLVLLLGILIGYVLGKII
jgi:hypothetical protein